MNTAVPMRAKPANKVLRTIAVLKFIETVAVAAAGLVALQLLDPATLEDITAWSQALPGLAEQRFAQRVLDQLSGITAYQIKALGAGAFVFAAIFLAEGIGLWLQRRWAEWLAVVATALFIPLEILELFRHASASKMIALVVNVLVVGYLIARIVSAKLERKTG
ncbi:MAG: hypothetical protein JWR16_275 [Nevskia sp.]|nr:hypothetical protein [Nevskia sp.]